jgi:hypothetical protein
MELMSAAVVVETVATSTGVAVAGAAIEGTIALFGVSEWMFGDRFVSGETSGRLADEAGGVSACRSSSAGVVVAAWATREMERTAKTAAPMVRRYDEGIRLYHTPSLLMCLGEKGALGSCSQRCR